MHAVYIRASVRGKKLILNWVVVYLTLFIMCGIIVLKLTSLLVNYFKIIMVFRNSMTKRKAFKLNMTKRPKTATLVVTRGKKIKSENRNMLC